MTILILIRHASNDYLKEGRLAGWTPGVHLNEDGRREAETLAQRLAAVPLEAIYSSPLERAFETAEAIAAPNRLAVAIRPRLGEGQAGEWTGRLLKELREGEAWKAMQAKPVGTKVPGVESIDEIQARMVAEVEDIRRAHTDGVVAVVSHADPLKALIAHYLCWDLNYYERIAISPASVSILRMEDGNARLGLLNHTGDIPKLEKPKDKSK